MRDEPKPFIFEKREVAFIFICIILIALIAFIQGIKIGKSYTFKMEGFSKEDKKQITFKSQTEEYIEKESNIVSEVDLKRSNEKFLEDKKLIEEFKKIENELTAKKKSPQKTQEAPQETKIERRDPKEYKGKYTIELAIYRSFADSEKFADGFRIRGYDPIIQEVQTMEQGIVYRVSLGVFISKQKAQEHILAESSLFKGQNYRITQFE
jgi:hypothetical protein